MKTTLAATLTLAVTLLIAVYALAEDRPTEPKAQTVCPVTGDAINKAFYADYEGKRVYFCCAHCPAAFKKDPAKYVKALEDQGVTLEATPKPQTLCPVLGEKINKAFYADHEGKRVYFCCAMCRGKFKKDPAKYMTKLQEQGVTPEDTPADAAVWTCSMHPDVKKDKAGTCPKCGMDLVQTKGEEEAGEHEEHGEHGHEH